MRAMVAPVVYFQWALFALLFLSQAALVAIFLARKSWRAYPAFFSYILLNLLQGGALFAIYRSRGFSSDLAQYFGWASQGAIILARALAIAELCRHLLARYSGIWALTKRLIFVCGVALALYSVFAAGRRWDTGVLKADRGLELTVIVVIVVLFLCARNYGIVASPIIHALALGFCLNSAFWVLNDAVLEQKFAPYDALWNILSALTYLATLLLWIWAFRNPLPDSEVDPTLLPRDVYRVMAPEVNVRLRLLNESLSKLYKAEARRS
jgi:hypothetical protein